MAVVRISRIFTVIVADALWEDEAQARDVLESQFSLSLRDESPTIEVWRTGSRDAPEYRVLVTLTGSTREPHEVYVLRRLDERLAAAARRAVDHPWSERTRFRLVGQRVECPVPFPERLIPGFPTAPLGVVKRAIRETMAFVEDRQLASVGLSVMLRQGGAAIVLESEDNDAEVARAAEAFVAAAAARPRELRSPPPGALTSPRVVALLTTALASVSVGLSFVHLSWPGLALLISTVFAGLGAAVVLPRRLAWADWRLVLVGIAPMAVVLTFAATYALIAHDSGTAITHSGHRVDSVGDALLLSINVALTGGIPDLTLTGTVRSVVYIEILLFLGFVGANVAVAGRWAATRLSSLLVPREGQRIEG